MDVWLARNHFVLLMMQVIKSSSLLLKDSFLPGSKNPLRKKDRESISTLEEKQGSLEKLRGLENNLSRTILSLEPLMEKIQPLTCLAMDL